VVVEALTERNSGYAPRGRLWRWGLTPLKVSPAENVGKYSRNCVQSGAILLLHRIKKGNGKWMLFRRTFQSGMALCCPCCIGSADPGLSLLLPLFNSVGQRLGSVLCRQTAAYYVSSRSTSLPVIQYVIL